jgi:hypothetical protein
MPFNEVGAQPLPIFPIALREPITLGDAKNTANGGAGFCNKLLQNRPLSVKHIEI